MTTLSSLSLVTHTTRMTHLKAHTIFNGFVLSSCTGLRFLFGQILTPYRSAQRRFPYSSFPTPKSQNTRQCCVPAVKRNQCVETVPLVGGLTLEIPISSNRRYYCPTN